MYFLDAALSGMRRRLMASALTVLGGTALLTASAAIGLWAFWLNGHQNHLKTIRTASVFVDTADNAVVEDVLTKVMQVKGIESARIVTAQEFESFLKQHFPDLQSALSGLGEEVIPKMLEVVFPIDTDPFSRGESVEAISAISNVARIDDGASRLAKALTSLHWLSVGGMALSLGLWIVLFIVCLGHYQNILYTDQQEVQLVRSFGGTKLAIIGPWLVEAVIHSLLTGAICIALLVLGKAYMSDVYNQFFGTLGYEPFQLGVYSFFLSACAVSAMALIAHISAGLFALWRGRLA